MSKFPRFYYVLFGIIDAFALISAFILSLSVLPFYFSYFTVLSNILITVIFLYFGFVNPKKVSKTLEWVYGAAVLYMTITGVIYWNILVNNHSLSLDPWINLTLHGLMPIVAFLSWVIFPLGKLKYQSAWQWLTLPLLFVFYTLIRGAIVKWYPYPFLNPVISHGYFQVVINVSVILIGSWLAGFLLIWVRNHLNFRK